MSDVIGTVAQVLAEDTPCRRCGYNLRGLAATGLCPECGTPIALSLVGNLLKQADPDWLERVRFGTALKIWNILLAILVGVATGVIIAAGLPQPLIMIIGIAGGALGLWAAFLITSQEPRISLQEDPVTLRKVLRACAALGFVGGVLSNANITGNWTAVVQVVGAVLSLVKMFVAWGELLYFRKFAHRIPDPKLAKSTTLLMWVGPITGALLIVIGVVAALAVTTVPGAPGAPVSGAPVITVTATPGPGMGMALGGGVCFFAAFVLYLLLWYMRLLAKYRKAFRTAASESRTSSSGDSIA